MKEKFKAGDRCAYYFEPGRFTGTVERITPNGHLEIIPDKGSTRKFMHPKQCRRLRRKKRREFEISISSSGEIKGCSEIGDSNQWKSIGFFYKDNNIVHVREVRK